MHYRRFLECIRVESEGWACVFVWWVEACAGGEGG